MIERVACTESTNSDLLNRLRGWPPETAFAPILRVADVQTGGRGRHGRVWHGEAGAALTFSLAWASSRDDLSGLSLAIGVALATTLDQALDHAPARRIGLKWPNDLVLVDSGEASALLAPTEGIATAAKPRLRKLGGILIETAPLGGRRVAVIGVGLNVRAPGQRALEAACLRELDPRAEPEAVLQSLVEPLLAALRRFDAAGWPAFAADFDERDVLRGRRIRRLVDGRAAEGQVVGLSPRGELRVVGADGVERAVGSGEVTPVEAGRGERADASRDAAPTALARSPC